MEAKTQQRLIKFLKSKGCYVIRNKPGPNTAKGCPDVLALKEGFWAAFEVKASKKAKFQVLQEETIQKLAGWSFARVVYPENYEQVIAELEPML